MWAAAVVVAAVLLVAVLLHLVLDMDEHVAMSVAVLTLGMLLSGVIVRPHLPAGWRGPSWVPWVVPPVFLVGVVAVWLRAALRPEPPRPEAGTCARCLRVLYDDGSGRKRYIDRDDSAYLCPPEVRDPAHRRHQIVQV